MTKQRLYIENNLQSRPLLLGLRWLFENTLSSGYLAVNVKKSIDITLKPALGEAIVRELKKSNKFSHMGKTFYLEFGDNTFFNIQGPLLVVYPKKRLLDIIDDSDVDGDILVVPWRMEDVNDWINTWGADKIIENGIVRGKQEFSLSRFTQIALEDLTSIVNLSNELATYRDESDAIVVLKTLVESGESLNPDTVKSFLKSRGWGSKGANRAAEIIQKLGMGKRLRCRDSGLEPRHLLKYWNEQLNKSQE